MTDMIKNSPENENDNVCIYIFVTFIGLALIVYFINIGFNGYKSETVPINIITIIIGLALAIWIVNFVFNNFDANGSNNSNDTNANANISTVKLNDTSDNTLKYRTFPELENKDLYYGIEYLQNNYPYLKPDPVKAGSYQTQDYRLNRVRLYYDANIKISGIPSTG